MTRQKFTAVQAGLGHRPVINAWYIDIETVIRDGNNRKGCELTMFHHDSQEPDDDL